MSVGQLAAITYSHFATNFCMLDQLRVAAGFEQAFFDSLDELH